MSTTPTTAAVPGESKEPSITAIFIARMKREGRFSEWQKALATVQQETGKKYAQVKYTAMKQCGYQGPDHERQLHLQWLAMEQAKSQLSVEQKAEAHETFEAALAKLPLKADRQVELEWIMSHTALTRRARGADKAAPVLITAEDILAAAHGPAPSRHAAIKLQLFVDDPDELSKAMTVAVRKGEGDGTGRDSDVVDDPGIDEVQRLLKAVSDDLHENKVKAAIDLLTSSGYTITKTDEATSPAA